MFRAVRVASAAVLAAARLASAVLASRERRAPPIRSRASRHEGDDSAPYRPSGPATGRRDSSTQKGQSAGASGQRGSGCQPWDGRQAWGVGGQPGGGLKYSIRLIVPGRSLLSGLSGRTPLSVSDPFGAPGHVLIAEPRFSLRVTGVAKVATAVPSNRGRDDTMGARLISTTRRSRRSSSRFMSS